MIKQQKNVHQANKGKTIKEKQHKNGSRSVTHAALTPRWGGELSLIMSL